MDKHLGACQTHRCGASTDIEAINIYASVWVRNKNLFLLQIKLWVATC